MLKPAFYKKINRLLLDLLTQIPASRDLGAARTSLQLSKAASLKAAGVSGVLSLPPGPLAMATLLPDMAVVWKIQVQLVADIAHLHGKHHQLTRETLLYCLFGPGQSATQDLVVRIGERFVVRRSSQKIFETMLGKIGLRVGRSVLGERIARFVPLVGALLIARYSFNDTEKVGKTAEELFSSSIEVEEYP